MLKLTDSLTEIEKKIKSLLDEVNSLKAYALALEKQNEQLRTKLYEKENKKKGRENLVKLYEEGFHICHAHFGRVRQENQDCLFCLSFLKKDLKDVGAK